MLIAMSSLSLGKRIQPMTISLS